MKDSVEIKINTYNNGLKGASFSINLNGKLLDKQENYLEEQYKGRFTIDVSDGKNKLEILHFNKSPKDTIVKDGEIVADVAIKLEDIKFNGISCHPVDLHENYFFPAEWHHDLDEKFKNNLYFGYNGRYEYCFEKPVVKYVLAQHKKYKKEDFVLEKIDDVTEDLFVTILKDHIEQEKSLFRNSS